MSPRRGDTLSVPKAQGDRTRRTRFCHPQRGDALLRPEDASRAAGAGLNRIRRMWEAFPGFTGGAVFAETPQLSLRGHTFFCLARKKYAKKRRRTRNSAYAQKDVSLHFTCYRYTGGQGTPFGRPSNWVSASHDTLYVSLC